MIFKRRKIIEVESEKVSTTIQRLEVLAEHLEHTASVLEVMVKTLREEEEGVPRA